MTTATKQPRKTLPGVTTKSVWLPPRIGIYGAAGIGKSTFGADAPDPIFLTTESGIENLDIARFPVAASIDTFRRNLNAVATGDHDYKSVVVDTLNGVMTLYYERYKDKYDFANYGGTSAWKAVAQFARQEILAPLDACQRRGMFVIVLAHIGTINQKNPIGEDYMKFVPSINKFAWEEFCGWFDVIGRADYMSDIQNVIVSKYKGEVVKRVGKIKTDRDATRGGKSRCLIFEGGMEQDTKCRVGYELPPQMPLSWSEFAAKLGNVKAMAAEVRDLWRYVATDKLDATLKYLGIDNLDRLEDANRSRLSTIRNRLLEMRDEAAQANSEAPKSVPDPDPQPDGDGVEATNPAKESAEMTA